MSQLATPSSKKTGALIQDWRPEDSAFWQQRGHRIATRNLWISIPCLLLAFCVWMLFSAVAVNLNKVGFTFTTDQLFLLTALPSVSGAILRVPYSFVIRCLAAAAGPPSAPVSCWCRACGWDSRYRTAARRTACSSSFPAVRLRRRQLCLQHGQHQLLLPESASGRCVGA